MSLFNIKIANKSIGIETVHVFPYTVCRKFITEDSPDFYVRSTKEDIDILRLEYRSTEEPLPQWDGSVEVLVVFRKVVEALLEYDTFLFHGAVIAFNGSAYIFTGNSGIGKTTHIRRWLKELPGAYVVNGDKPFILMDGIPMACGSPWAGKENMTTDSVVPIKAIVILERSEDNQIRPVSMAEAFPALLQQIYLPAELDKIKKTMSLLKALEGKVDFYHFKMNNFKEDCFRVAYDALMEKA